MSESLISLEREISWINIISANSSQFHSNPIFVTPHKTPNTIMDLYDGWEFDLKSRINIWTRMDVFPIKYVTLAHIFQSIMRFRLLVVLPSGGIICCDALFLYLDCINLCH